jgi:4-amino-4-deoxy-L-arabinose transferase-like glycosyltransferase
LERHVNLRSRLLKTLASRKCILWAVLLALALRVIWALVAGDAYRYYDSDSYVKIAESLRAGNGFVWGDQRLGRPPLYPLLVAATRYSLFGQHFALLYLVQAALGAASVLFFGWGARRLVGRAAGGITALAVALDPFLVFFTGTVLTETLFVFLLAGFFYISVVVLEMPRARTAALAGIFAGAAFLTRPSLPGVVILTAATIVIWAHRRRKAVVAVITMLLAAAVVVSPWAIRNCDITGRWICTTLGVGASLYDGIGPQADGSSNMNFLHDMPELAKMDEVERDDYLRDKAIDAFLESPGRVLKLTGVKAWRFWSPVPNNEDYRSWLHVLVSLFAVIPVYVLAGAAVFSGVLRRRDFFILAGPPAYFTIVHMIFVSSVRYRVPVMPFVAMIAAAYLSARLVRGRKGIAEAHKGSLGAHERHKTLKATTSHKRRGLWSPFRAVLLLVVLAGLAGAIAYAYYVNWVANPSNIQALAVKEIGLLFPGKEVKVGTGNFGLFSGLDLRDVEVFEPGLAETPVAKIEVVRVDFDRRAFLRLKLLARAVTASGLYLDLKRAEDGGWNLALPLTAKHAGTAAGETRTGTPESTRGAGELVSHPFTIKLQSGFVSVDDRYSRYAISVALDGATAVSDRTNPSLWQVMLDFGGGLLGQWHASGTANIRSGTFKADFRVANVELGEGLTNRLPPGARYGYEYFKPAGTAQISGAASYGQPAGWTFNVAADLSACSATVKSFPVGMTQLYGRLNFTRDGCRFEKLTGRSLAGDLVLSGKVSGYSKDAGYEIRVKATDIEPSDELAAAMAEKTRRAVASFNPRGKFDFSAEIRRDQGKDLPTNTSLDIYPKGATASYSGFPYPIEEIRGHLSYGNNTVTIDGISARHGQTVLLFEGSAGEINKSPRTNLGIKATDVAIDRTLRAALPQDKAGIWDKLQPAGTCNLDVRIARSGPEAAALSIVADLKDAYCNPSAFPYSFSAGSGQVRYADGKVTADSLIFRHGDGRWEFTGTSDVNDGSIEMTVSARDVAIDSELKAALPEATYHYVERMGLTGTVTASIDVTGGPDGKLDFRNIRGSLREAGLTLPDVAVDLGAADIEFSLEPQQLEVSSLDGVMACDSGFFALPALRFAAMSLPATEVAATARLGIGGRSDWEIRFESRQTAVGESLVARLPKEARDMVEPLNVSGFADISGSASLVGGDSWSLSYSALVDCLDGVLGGAVPASEIEGRFTVTGGATADGSHMSSSGAIASVVVDGKHLDDIKYSVTQKGDDLRIEQFEARALGGTLSGQGQVSLSGKKGYAFQGKARGMDLGEVLKRFYKFEKPGVSGTITGDLKLMSRSGGVNDILGHTEAEVTEGTLWEVPVLLAMMNVINLRLPERTQFRSAKVHMNWTAKGTNIESLTMSSNPATLFGAGTVSPDGNVDMIFYSHPGRVPVFSPLAGELGKNIVKARLTGTFAAPSVAIVPSGPFGKVLEALGLRERRPRN